MVEAHAEASPYPNPHSPAERRKLSNLGHWQQGGVLGAAGGLALVDGVRPELGWPGRYSARSGAAAGLALAGFIVLGSFHHGGPVLYLRHEHQDRQHLLMAAITAAGGLVESASEERVSRLAGAAALAGVGAMFLAHEQHGSGEARVRAERTHRRLAFTLLGAGGAKAADELGAPGPWRLAWPLAALAVAAQLLAYREPPGAYE